jgi:8-oxo-dGTP pyrophosphatase MutT (NUDIX family)
MLERSYVTKVLTYITHGAKLLVFRQPDFPEQGVQVPGGSVEPGEALAAAALREAREETGLFELAVARYLGSRAYELKVDVGPPHLRHFFQLSCPSAPRRPWQHLGSFSVAGAAPVRFELGFQPLACVHLSWEMDAYLQVLRNTE